MRRILPALAAFALVIVGVGGGLAMMASRDRGSLEPTTSQAALATGPSGLPAGNVVVEFDRGRDRRTIDALAEQLGATDSPATRAAGQALVSKRVPGRAGILATTGATSLAMSTADDPRLAAFVREHLGRTDQR